MRAEQIQPLYVPSSPLSPAPKASITPVSPPRVTARRSAKNTNNLRLTNLGRFPDDKAKHGLQTTASKYSRQFSEAQLALHNFQRELIANATRSSRIVSTTVDYEPVSPKLLPLGSPGPVTPLMLEEEGGGYLLAGAVGRGMKLDGLGERELVECLLREDEEKRRHSPVAERVSTVSLAGGNH